MPAKRQTREHRVRKGRVALTLVPLLALATVPFLNRTEPRLFGLPLFFWSQFLLIALSAVTVATVMIRSRESSPWD